MVPAAPVQEKCVRSLLLLCGIAVTALAREECVSCECPDLPATGDFLLFFVFPIVAVQLRSPHVPPRMAHLQLKNARLWLSRQAEIHAIGMIAGLRVEPSKTQRLGKYAHIDFPVRVASKSSTAN